MKLRYPVRAQFFASLFFLTLILFPIRKTLNHSSAHDVDNMQ